MQLRSFDTIDQRVLAAIEFLDASTGARITTPLNLSARGYGFVRNRNGLYVINKIIAAPGRARERLLLDHLNTFDAAPSRPPAGSETELVTVVDPKGRYLPQTFSTALPRVDEDLVAPIQVSLFPSPAAPVAPNWSGVRCSFNRADASPLVGARVTLIRDSDDAVLGQSFTDERGEALVIAVGIPVIDFTAPNNGNGNGNGSVGAATTAARITVETKSNSSWPPLPFRFNSNTQLWGPTQGALPQLELRTGQILTQGLSLTLEPQP